jgi:putative endonuclease
MRQFWVYILTSRSGVLYVGVTNDLERRTFEHKQKRVPGFTARYNVDRLVFYEAFPEALSAIAAEKKIKGWRREKKVALIESQNPQWKDLSADWDNPWPLPSPPEARDPSVA